MKKLRCRSYLTHANTREKLWIYVEHLSQAHASRMPNQIKLWHLACSELSQKKAYEEVDKLAGQIEASYGEGLA